MRIPRPMAALASGALALLVAAALGTGALAQTSGPASAVPDRSPVPCPTSSASPGMMGDDGDAMGLGMMGDDGGASPGTTLARPCAGAEGIRIAVTLDDMMRIEPALMSVPAGVPVTFVVTNLGGIEHEFVLGDEAAQQEHEAAMQHMGGTMAMDDPDAIVVAPGATKELTVVFGEPGEMIAGCHVPGHYAAGMRAVITVTE